MCIREGYFCFYQHSRVFFVFYHIDIDPRRSRPDNQQSNQSTEPRATPFLNTKTQYEMNNQQASKQSNHKKISCLVCGSFVHNKNVLFPCFCSFHFQHIFNNNFWDGLPLHTMHEMVGDQCSFNTFTSLEIFYDCFNFCK